MGWEGERVGIDRSGVGGGESGDRQERGGMGERVGIERGSGVGGGERGDRKEWDGRRRVGTDSGVGGGESGDRHGGVGLEGREWG